MQLRPDNEKSVTSFRNQSSKAISREPAHFNQAFVKEFFPNQDPIARRIEVGAPTRLLANDEWMGSQRVTVTISGVMRDNRDQGLALPVAPQLIGLFRQMPKVNSGFKDLLVRSDVALHPLESSIEQQLHALDPQIPLSEQEDEGIARRPDGSPTIHRRHSCQFRGNRAAAGGDRNLRSDRISGDAANPGDRIRLALGAPRSAAVWLVSSQGVRMALAGVGIGLLGTVLAARSMASLLYGVSALDPLTLVSASVVLVAIALGACALPAGRAARIDPMRALRAE